MYMDLNIEKICGTSAISPDFESIANDPSFIFEPDAKYTTVVLYNSEGSVINVNSWLECANYVNGGWFSSFVDLTNYEKRLFYILIFTSVSIALVEIIKKYRGLKNSKI